GVTAAPLRVVDRDGDVAVLRGAGCFLPSASPFFDVRASWSVLKLGNQARRRDAWLPQWLAVSRRDLAGEADDVHAVGTIGGDVEVEHLIAVCQTLDAFEREAAQRQSRTNFLAGRVNVDE